MSEAWKAYCDGLDAKCLKLARSIKEPGVVTETTYHNSTPDVITMGIAVRPGFYDGEVEIVYSVTEGGRRRGHILPLMRTTVMSHFEMPSAEFMARIMANTFWGFTSTMAEVNKLTERMV